MHPIVLEQLARSHAEERRRRAEHRRHVALARQVSPVTRGSRVRLTAAGVALHLARTLDREGRVVPSGPSVAAR